MSTIKVLTYDELAKKNLSEGGDYLELKLETARLYIRAGNKEKAGQLISQSLKSIREIEYEFVLDGYSDHVVVANLFARLGEFNEVEKVLIEVSDKVENFKADEWSLGDKSKLLADIAHVYYLMGKEERAIFYLAMAYETANDLMIGPIDKAESLFKIACVYEEIGKAKEADNMLAEACLVTDKNIKGENVKITLYLNCAGVWYARNKRGNKEQVEKMTKVAYSLISSIRVDTTEVESMLEVASKYEAFGKRNEALGLINRAMEIVKAMRRPYDRMYGFKRLAYGYWEVGEKNRANELLSLALRTAEENKEAFGDVEFDSGCLEIAKTYARMGDLEKALEITDKMITRENPKFEALIEITRNYPL